MLCCLLAFLTVGPIGLAVTVPRGGRRDYARLWLPAALVLLAGSVAAIAVLIWYAPGQSFFRHICSVLPLKT